MSRPKTWARPEQFLMDSTLAGTTIGRQAHRLSLRWAFVVPAVLTVGIVVLAPSFNVGRTAGAEPPAVQQPA